MHLRPMLVFALVIASSALHAQKAPDLAPYLMADRTAEIALARTAAPTDISGKATVLVLTRTGYVEAAKGTNGFTCVVMRSFSAAPDDPDFWKPQISAPHCFNPPAVRSVLPAMLAQINWAIAGATPTQLDARIKSAFESKSFPMPATGAMAYMLSPKQRLSATAAHWKPHLMFYFEPTLAASTFGAGGMTAPVIDASASDKHVFMQVIYIPTATWSDGTPVTPAGKDK